MSEQQFDLILHLDHPRGDDTLCKFHPHAGPADYREPWWSLGRRAVENMLRTAGCDRVAIVNEWQFSERLYRTFFIAYRA